MDFTRVRREAVVPVELERQIERLQQHRILGAASHPDGQFRVEDSMEEILRSRDTRFTKDYGPLPRRLRGQLEAFLRCGDAHFGFLHGSARRSRS